MAFPLLPIILHLCSLTLVLLQLSEVPWVSSECLCILLPSVPFCLLMYHAVLNFVMCYIRVSLYSSWLLTNITTLISDLLFFFFFFCKPISFLDKELQSQFSGASLYLHLETAKQTLFSWFDFAVQRNLVAGDNIYFVVVQLPSSVLCFATPWTAAHQASLSLTISQGLPQVHVHCFGDAIQPSPPLMSSSPSALSLLQHHGLFQWVSWLHQMTKILEFQLQHQSFQGIFRVDFL